jgi:hypothetical protein
VTSDELQAMQALRLAAAAYAAYAAAAETSLAAEKAEVERLREEVEEGKFELLDERGAKLAAETSLAAATELLRRAHDTLARLGLQWVDAPVPLIGDLRTFLAAQPAAPIRKTADPCPLCDGSGVMPPADVSTDVLLCGACTAGRPADCSGWCGRRQPAAPARTEAEQRVLDACPGISRAALNRWQHRQSGLGVFAKAELARREAE